MRDIARATDPITSHLGAQEVTESGRRKSQKDIILTALRDSNGSTMSEVSMLTDLTEWQVTKRLSDLKNDGLIEQEGVAMGQHGMQGVWFVIDKPEQGTLL